MLKYCSSIFTTHYSGDKTMPIKKLVTTKKTKVATNDIFIKLKADLEKAKAELKLMKANNKAELAKLKIELKQASAKPTVKAKKTTTTKPKIVRTKKATAK